jgi:hypothetical protein
MENKSKFSISWVVLPSALGACWFRIFMYDGTQTELFNLTENAFNVILGFELLCTVLCLLYLGLLGMMAVGIKETVSAMDQLLDDMDDEYEGATLEVFKESYIDLSKETKKLHTNAKGFKLKSKKGINRTLFIIASMVCVVGYGMLGLSWLFACTILRILVAMMIQHYSPKFTELVEELKVKNERLNDKF